MTIARKHQTHMVTRYLASFDQQLSLEVPMHALIQKQSSLGAQEQLASHPSPARTSYTSSLLGHLVQTSEPHEDTELASSSLG